MGAIHSLVRGWFVQWVNLCGGLRSIMEVYIAVISIVVTVVALFFNFVPCSRDSCIVEQRLSKQRQLC